MLYLVESAVSVSFFTTKKAYVKLLFLLLSIFQNQVYYVHPLSYLWYDRISIFLVDVFTGLVSPVLFGWFCFGCFSCLFLVNTILSQHKKVAPTTTTTTVHFFLVLLFLLLFKIVLAILFQVPSNQRDIRYYVIYRFLKTVCPPAFVFLVSCRR